MRFRGKSLGKSSPAKPEKFEDWRFSRFAAKGRVRKQRRGDFSDLARFRFSTKCLVKRYTGETGNFARITRGDPASRPACWRNMPAAIRNVAGILAGMLCQHAGRDALASRSALFGPNEVLSLCVLEAKA